MDIVTDPPERGKESARPDSTPRVPKDTLFGLVEDIADATERHRRHDRAAHEAQVHGDPHGLRWLAEHARDSAETDMALAEQHAGMICAFLVRLGAKHFAAALSAHLAELPVVADLCERAETLEAAVARLGGGR